MFTPDNPLRKAIVWLVTWKWLKNFILLTILFNSVTIGLETKEMRVNPDYQETSVDRFIKMSGVICAIIFIIEFAFKVLAQGFIVHKRSYLRDMWNMLDFLIVMVSITELV